MSVPTDQPWRKWMLCAVLLALAGGVMVALRSCGKPCAASVARGVVKPVPAETKPATTTVPERDEVSEPVKEAVRAPVPTGEGKALPPPKNETGRGQLTLGFRFKGETLLATDRAEMPDAAVRPLRRVEGVQGIYYRVVDAEGRVLFENVVPDPRRVPWDTSDDGKKLSGGVATVTELPLFLRLPAGLKGRLQLLAMKTSGWTREELDKDNTIMGDFELR